MSRCRRYLQVPPGLHACTGGSELQGPAGSGGLRDRTLRRQASGLLGPQPGHCGRYPSTGRQSVQCGHVAAAHTRMLWGGTRAPASSLPPVSLVRGALPPAPGSMSQGMAYQSRLCPRPSCTTPVYITGSAAGCRLQAQAKACAVMCSIDCTLCSVKSRHPCVGRLMKSCCMPPPADFNLVALHSASHHGGING